MFKYFTIEELCRTSHKVKNIPSESERKHIVELIENLLDPIRESWNSPIIITSGFRCKELNKIVGGSSTSAHLLGYAADMIPANNNRKGFYEFIRDFLSRNNIPFDQLINEYPDNNGIPSWIHIGLKDRQNRQRNQVFVYPF